MRAVVSAKLAFNIVHDIELQKFIMMLNPSFVLPNRNALAGPLLEAAYKEACEDFTRVPKGSYVTGQCDGWKDTSKNNVQAMMLATNGHVSHL